MVLDETKLHLKMGFKSLYDFCTKELKYSEGAAYRRIQAMRLLKEVPEAKEKVRSGKISLSHISQVQKFVRSEEKLNNKTICKTQKLDLLTNLENTSTRECEQKLRAISPLAIPDEKTRTISATQTEIKFVADDELMKKLSDIKNLLSHKNQNPSYKELFHLLADHALVDLKRKRKINQKSIPQDASCPIKRETLLFPFTVQKRVKKTTPVMQSSAQSSKAPAQSKPCVKGFKVSSPKICQSLKPLKPRNVRYISPATKSEVWYRDKGCCTYVDQASKRKCGSRFQLEYDHIRPVAMGGQSTIENLRLLCRKHNQYFAQKYFKEQQ